jgi:hypothetical protein
MSTSKIDKEDMIAVILDAAPAEHQAALTSKQRVKGTSLPGRSHNSALVTDQE